jgi:hypothetical protein
MTKARDLAGIISGQTDVPQDSLGNVPPVTPTQVSDKNNTSTGYFDLPSGTTEQRPSSPSVGNIRYNSTLGKNEAYDSNGWTAIDTPPSVLGISPTTDLVGDATITITGSNFQSGATVSFIGNDASEFVSPTVTFVSGTQLTAKTPVTPLQADLDPYKIKVTNPTGLSIVSDPLLDAGSSPSWSTNAALGTFVSLSSFSETLTATDPDGQTVTYSTTDLPSNTSLSSSGVFTGTVPNVDFNTTNTFNVSATDGVNTTVKTFNIVYARPSALINGVGVFLDSAYTQITNGFYTFVPEYDMTLFMDMWGAGGGGGYGGHTTRLGGAGGEAYGEINVTAGTEYVFLVGAGGYYGNHPNTTVMRFPDGGGSYSTGNTLGAGGGGSTRFGEQNQSDFTITNSAADYNNTNAVYYMIAGGGGGGCEYGTSGSQGGYGGGLNGRDGLSYYSSDGANAVGRGGSQTGGGAAGYGGRVGSVAQAGDKYRGGYGASGGGGGYFGGGGSDGYYAQAGGGSGFLNSSYVTNGNFATTSDGGTAYYTAPNANSLLPSGGANGGVGNGGTAGNWGSDGGIYIINNPHKP